MVLHEDHIEIVEEFYKNPKSSKIYIQDIKILIEKCEQANLQLYNSIMAFCNDSERKLVNLPILKIPGVIEISH